MPNNCSDQLAGVRARYDVTKRTRCDFLDPASATAAAALLVPEVIAEGAIPNETGYKTVNNWRIVLGNRVPLPNTYVGYCAGDRTLFKEFSKEDIQEVQSMFSN